jgi:hypothetical protein
VFDNDGSSRVNEVTLPVEPERQTASVEEKTKATVSTAERPHAISPDEPSYEAPELMLPATQGEVPAPETVREASPSPETAEPETFQVTKAATIRNGPSAKAKIGTATPGAQLQVRRHENEWIQFVDPSSGNTGWIQSDLVAEATGSTNVRSANSEAQKPPQKRSVKKVVKQKMPSLKAAQPTPKPERSHADLPDDEDFIQDDRGSRPMGLFARRRMLREGLMSPGFLHPQ